MHFIRPGTLILHLTAVVAATAALAGCGAKFAGTFDGSATEGGAIHILPNSGVEAKNEIGPHELDAQQVTITNDSGVLTVNFGNCKLEGKATSPETALVAHTCTVKLGAWEGSVPLSGIVTMGDKSRGVRLEVVGRYDNGGTTVNYTYVFQGKRS